MSRIGIGAVLAILAVLIVAGIVLVRPFGGWNAGVAAEAGRVPPGDQEIAWIDAATNGSAWERFISAIHWVEKDRSDLRLKIVEDANAFPRLTTAVPEIAISLRGGAHRIWIRWYKLTNETGIGEWVKRLTRRDPPPLAIIGGGTSDRAAALADALAEKKSGASPLLLITTATADRIYSEKEQDLRDLMDLYSGRSFRFCFTNIQMAEAVMDFLLSREDLHERIGPVYRVIWSDDPYSIDLADRFREVTRRWTASAIAKEWISQATAAAQGIFPFPSGLNAGPFSARLRLNIPYSVGGFDQPNRPEREAIDLLLADLARRPAWQQSILCLPATTQSARRFLRGIEGSMPGMAERIVVATGDSFDFDTIYRDRRLTWPIQDLPFPLVFFSHRDPVDDRGGSPEKPSGDTAVSGSEDLLLYADIVQAVAETAFVGDRPLSNADEMAERLRTAKPARFDVKGNRLGGTGEHLVYLLPHRLTHLVLPSSTIEVWRAQDSPSARWTLRKRLTISYDDRRSLGDYDRAGK